MRRVSTYPVVGLLWVLALSASAQQIRVMQWNVGGNLGNIAGNNSAAAKAIARIANYNQPDIITFCELQDKGTTNTAAAMIDWVTNNLTYFGTQTGVTFWVDIAIKGDGYIRNGSISRYPISNPVTYSGGPRGMESFQIQLSGTNTLEVFHVHLKCCEDGCGTRQGEAESDATNMITWASTNSYPYIFTGDCNESEDPRDTPECAITSWYHPITTLEQGGGLVDYEPTTLSGDWRTWSTGNPAPFTNIRFDYILAATNRLSASSGYVFSTMDWASYGLYTNASPQNLAYDSQTASDHYCVVVDFLFPTIDPGFTVTPTNDLASIGDPGGPFAPTSQTYTIKNTNVADDVNWSVAKYAEWLDVSATSGLLAAGQSTNVTISVNTAANGLPGGTYAGPLRFRDATNGGLISRAVSLTVRLPPILIVSPGTGININGITGQPFNPSSFTYSLGNAGNRTLSWTANKNSNWIDLSSYSGTLEAGSNAPVVVSLDGAASMLSAGSYTDTIAFVNVTNGLGNTNRLVVLKVFASSGFFDDMENGTNGWAASNLWHIVGTSGCSNSYSPVHSWYYGQDSVCTYNPAGFTQGNLTSPLFLVPTNALLTYWSWEDIGFHDADLNVFISTNSWVTSNQVSTTSSSTSAWHLVVNDLTAFAGKAAELRFQFVPNAIGGGSPRGWYLDDIRVTASGPPALMMSPAMNVNAIGQQGGPFAPSSQVYTLVNTNGGTLDWSASVSDSWLTVSPTNGMLNSGASINVTASVNGNANGLSAGLYSNLVSFVNVTNGGGTTNTLWTLFIPGPVLSVNPTAGLDASGQQGGAFTPSSQEYVLSNVGSSTLSWLASLSNNWSSISTTNGILTQGQSTTITLSINSTAQTLVGGLYSNLMNIVSLTNGSGTTYRVATLLVRDGIPDAWRLQYFGHVDPRSNDLSRASDDADGDGFSNLQELLAGTDPTNAASSFRITAIAREGDDLRLTWSCVGGHTYALQGTTWVAGTGYTNLYSDISPAITAPGAGESTTNFLIAGALASPGWAAPSGQVMGLSGSPAQQSESTSLTVEPTAWNSRALVDARGKAVPMGNLVMFGTFSVDEPTIQSNFHAGNIGAIVSAFTRCGASFAVGDGAGAPGTWDAVVDGTSFVGQQMYILAVDQPSVEGATQLGIFTGSTWILPGDSTYTNIDLETATDFVVGAHGGSLTIDWGGPYTFTDTVQLAVIPVTPRCYRVRVVQ